MITNHKTGNRGCTSLSKGIHFLQWTSANIWQKSGKQPLNILWFDTTSLIPCEFLFSSHTCYVLHLPTAVNTERVWGWQGACELSPRKYDIMFWKSIKSSKILYKHVFWACWPPNIKLQTLQPSHAADVPCRGCKTMWTSVHLHFLCVFYAVMRQNLSAHMWSPLNSPLSCPFACFFASCDWSPEPLFNIMLLC